MTLRKLLKLLKRFFLFDMTYFDDYFCAVEKIAFGDLRQKMLKLDIPRAFVLYQSVFSLIAYVYQNRWSRLVNLLIVNIVYLEHLDRYNCLWIAGFDLLASSMLRDMYYKQRNRPTYQLLRQIMIKDSLGDKYFTSPQCTLFSRKLSIVKVVQLVALGSRNVMQLLIFGFSKLV